MHSIPTSCSPNDLFLLHTFKVEWELLHPCSGVVFKAANEGFSANHMYTTYSHAPMDMDGPR